jgi:hypothetical protein
MLLPDRKYQHRSAEQLAKEKNCHAGRRYESPVTTRLPARFSGNTSARIPSTGEFHWRP